MIACVCSGYSTRDIALLIAYGDSDLESLQKMGVCTGCQTCKDYILQLIEDVKEINKEV